MLIIILILGLLWIFAVLKSILFWTYLWQLKEYHIKRLFAHFSTEKGRILLFDKARIAKMALLILFFVFPLPSAILISLLYIAEDARFFVRRVIKPSFTKKILFVIILSFLAEILFFVLAFNWLESRIWLSALIFPALLVVGDILSPLLVSFLILAAKPIGYLFVKSRMEKARNKIAGMKDLKVIAITGSCGKSSVKNFLYEILSEKFKVLKTEKNINAEIGIANAILENLDSSHQVFIAEIGAYEKGKIEEVSRMIRPDIGILTGINEQHMATFGSLENIISGKFEIVSESSKSVLNYSNKYIKERNKDLGAIKVSLEERLDVWAEDILVEKEVVAFKAFSKDGDSAFFRAGVIGKQQIINLLLAIAAAKDLGMSMEEISRAKISNKDKIIKRSPYIIDNSYSSNPEGAIANIDHLKLFKGKRAVVMPCLIELGESSERVHKEIAEKINEVCDVCVATSKDCFLGTKAVYSESPEEIMEMLKDFKSPEDVILFEGRVPRDIIKEAASM
ncbi:MAG: hypothetical protein A2365_01410 [Candidatus Nealsonbacteria bacterium RIFOXYB1_FULL_40_15]|uniref:Uncharacterized protein n=2 Tax=Candidatus Nealsoniibacteriota TaxID=1817911 RepID=A0A1G2EPZ6_9BACT|nr:MAG: hypothetical protein A2365_01410 [Candidatus Nealsonbacteria bacterium RIFOXYB1_FULL_40_15]OGZ27874.1 MAG: hypothetical protein A2427_04140 [Candidatus Nealsonbacteria bacterium RIFOXYC1_FULL_40_7]OGZ28033.1 MAG: hypothetical protein A2562_01490 [Candidatus Nealsonbacteria bacterium RIFOXYD1_FULL_39_11]